MFASIKNPEPALLPTLNSAVAALEKTGGKIVCSLSALPTWGPNRLFLRDDGKHPGGEIDKKLFTTEHPAWKKTAEKMAAAGVGVDFFLAAPSGGFLDIATVGKYTRCRPWRRCSPMPGLAPLTRQLAKFQNFWGLERSRPSRDDASERSPDWRPTC